MDIRRMVHGEELKRLLLTGLTFREACRTLGVSEGSGRYYLNDTSWMGELRSLSNDIHERICREIEEQKRSLKDIAEDASAEALETLVDLMRNGQKEATRVKCAESILDRHGELVKVQKSEVDSKHNFINPITLQLAAQAAQEMDSRDERLGSTRQLGEGHSSGFIPGT